MKTVVSSRLISQARVNSTVQMKPDQKSAIWLSVWARLRPVARARMA